MNKSNIALTERAANHVKNFLAKQDDEINLRVGVKPTGCSGYQYVVEATENINASDQLFESFGVKIVVDDQSFKYLSGTELDYVKEGINEGFRFNNPNVQATCGCGESFTISEETN
ncbi:MAG: iron-sulfur cluster assembly accessory protein [Gammaproteobacteria bacterium]|nr:iron-sulfur cluster assembly accessory protein [Gammaproteobacteria bacterium]